MKLHRKGEGATWGGAWPPGTAFQRKDPLGGAQLYAWISKPGGWPRSSLSSCIHAETDIDSGWDVEEGACQASERAPFRPRDELRSLPFLSRTTTNRERRVTNCCTSCWRQIRVNGAIRIRSVCVGIAWVWVSLVGTLAVRLGWQRWSGRVMRGWGVLLRSMRDPRLVITRSRRERRQSVASGSARERVAVGMQELMHGDGKTFVRRR